MNRWSTVRDFLSRRPVATQALVQAFLALVISFGVPLTTEQAAGVMGFCAALTAWLTDGVVIDGEHTTAKQMPPATSEQP